MRNFDKKSLMIEHLGKSFGLGVIGGKEGLVGSGSQPDIKFRGFL